MRVIILILFLFPSLCFSQKQGNIWYFAESSGLNFSSGVAVPITGGQIHSGVDNSEGCSSISDSSGNILFCASPNSIWNRNNQLMPNGTGLMGGISCTQGVLILPKPLSNDSFYVFTLDEMQNNFAKGLRYSIVYMCLDNGNGDLISATKNTLLLDSTGEKMTATYHANGTDIWFVTRKHYTNKFYSYLLTSSGISAPVISAIGWANPMQAAFNAIGQMKISPDGSKLAMAIGNQTPHLVNLFDFNNSNGTISNYIDLPTSTNGGNPYGVAFSSDNSKLYKRGGSPTGLDQYDLSSGIPDTIKNSYFNVTTSTGYAGTGLQLANDGKIYVSQNPDIGIINSPNLSGNACNFIENAITTCNSAYTFPGFIDSYKYKNGIPSCGIGIQEQIDESTITISPNPINSTFTIKSSITDKLTLDLFDVNGRHVLSKSICGTTNIDVNSFDNGIYTLTIKSAVRISNKKLVIAR